MNEERLNKLDKKVLDLQKKINKRFDKNTDLHKLNFKNSDSFWSEWNDFYSEKGLYSEYLDLKKEIDEFKLKIKDRYEPENVRWGDVLVNFEEELHSCKNIIERYIQLLKEKATEKMVERINCAIKKQEEHDKNIMNMMGIFLSIFSVIGLGVSSVLNLENNHIATWLMICGTILITMTGLFALINKKLEIIKILVIIIGLVLFGVGGCTRCVFPEKKTKLELLEKDVENLSKNLDTKELKIDIEKLKSKIEELENSKSKDKK